MTLLNWAFSHHFSCLLYDAKNTDALDRNQKTPVCTLLLPLCLQQLKLMPHASHLAVVVIALINSSTFK